MAKGSNNLSGRRSSTHNTKPYDANNSFVKKVATKVTDFIPQRSWISKWFNSSQNEGDTLNDNESPEDVESEEDIQKPPPLKRPCIRMDVTHPPGTFSIQPRAKPTISKISPSKQQYPIRNETSEDFSKPAMAGPSGMNHLVSSTPATQMDIRSITPQRSELNSLVATANNGTINGTDDNSESSESTSGCSSLIPQTNRQEAPSSVSYNSPFSNRKRFRNDKLSFTNHAQSPRSLFLDNTVRDTLSSRKPSFNASIMTNTPDRASPLASPFYSGNITFGGANAAGLYKRGRNLFNSAKEIQLKVPKRTSVEVKPSNTAGVDSSGMSQTAKKILEALEHFSSPITDAKKIPLKVMNNTSLINKKRSREETIPSTTKVGLRHLTRELTVPTVPDILKLKRRQKLQDTTAAARRIISARSEAPPPQEYHIRTQATEDTKHHGKVKVKAIDLEKEETVEPVNLPNIPLPISSLPNFNFMQPINSSLGDKANVGKGEGFTFASPIKVPNITKNLKSINNFTFSTPINPDKHLTEESDEPKSPKAIGTKSNLTISDSVPSVAQNFIWSGSSAAPRPKEKVKSNDSAVPSISNELKSGSVVDVLCPKPSTIDPERTNGTKMVLNSIGDVTNNKAKSVTSDISKNDGNSKPSLQQNVSTMWECSECLFKNSNSETQCFACKTAKSSHQNKKTFELASSSSNYNESNAAKNDNFGSQFKLSTNQWECSSCFVRNKQTDTKCVACSALKQSTGQETKSIAINPTKSDAHSDKPSEKLWECSTCKLKNSENSSTCLSCKASKAGLPNKNSQKNTDDTNAGTNASKDETIDKFKPSKDTWECPCCMVRNALSADTCPCCNTTKPSTGVSPKNVPSLLANGFGDKFKKPEGAWNCDTCMVQNEQGNTECIACGGLKPGSKKSDNSASTTSSNIQFKFDMPVSTGSFKFGIDKAGKEESKNAMSTNGFKFGESQPSSQITQFTFGIQKEGAKTADQASENNVTQTAGSGFTFQPSAENDKESNVKQTAETVKDDIKPTFSFGTPKSESNAVKNDKQPVNTTPSSTFTFGVPKTTAIQSDSKEGGQGSATENISTELPQASTVTTESPALSTNTLPSLTQSSQETKPTATFSFGVPSSSVAITSNTSTTVVSSLPSATQSSFTFAGPKSTAQATPVATFGQITTAAPTPNLTGNTFAFGENKIIDGTSVNKPFGSMPNSAPGGSLFPNIPSTPSLFSNNETKTTSTFGQTATEDTKHPTFGASGAKSSTFTIPENKAPAFGNTENKSSIFGSSEQKLPAFGSTDSKATSLFNSSPQLPATTPAATPFGASSAMPTLFGSSVTPVFGSNTAPTFTTESSSSIFGSTTSKPNETSTPSSNLFTFGATSAQPVAQAGTGFNFSANPSTTESTQKPLFTFGSNPATPQSSGNLFGNTFNNPTSTNTSGFTFNAPKPEIPTFGQPTATTPLFGAPQPAAQSPASSASSFSSAPASTGFNFGATAPTTTSGGFNFGDVAPTSVSSTGFNFNPPNAIPTFDPNTPPSFKFTAGNAPLRFNAAPTLPQRKFKKAYRRIR